MVHEVQVVNAWETDAPVSLETTLVPDPLKALMGLLTCRVSHRGLHSKQVHLHPDALVSERIIIDQGEEAFEKMHEGTVLHSMVVPTAGASA